MSDQKSNDGWLVAGLLILCLAAFAGPAKIAEKSKDSTAERIFIWLFIRSFWFGAGALATYLYMRP